MFAILVVIFTVLANLLISIVVIKKNPNSATNRLVAILSIITALWTVFNFLALSPGSEADRLFWVRTVMFVTSSYGTIILLLAETYPNSRMAISKSVLAFIGIVNILSYSLAYTPLMFSSLQNKPDGSFSLMPAWGISIFGLGFMGFMIWGFVKLFKKLKNSSGLLRIQLRLFLTGLILSFTLLSLTNFVAVVVFQSIQLTYLGPPFTLIFFAFVMYAIIRHRLLDINYLVGRAVSYTLFIAIIIGIESTLLFFTTHYFADKVDETITAILGSLFIILGYRQITKLISHFTDRIFFQGRYDQEDLLKALTTIMVREANIRSLTRKLTSTLTEQMRLTMAEFILITDNTFNKDELLQTLFHASSVPLIFEELTDENLKEIMRQKDITLTIPLRVQKDKIGLLVLGPKASGDLYADRDLETLEIFAPQAAIAIQNAQHLDEIESFNKTLEAKVEERTHELKISQSQALKLKDEFVFIATHDLATPVTAISGFMAMIKERKEKMSSSLREDLTSIADASARLKVLVNDLLQVARSDSGTITVSVEPLSVKPVLAQIVEELSPQATQHQVDVSLKIPASTRIMADPKKFAEIAENLVSNGIKYNKEGGKLSISAEEDARFVTLIFKDTGLGIPKSEQGEVFSKFYRSSKPEVRQKPGTGLGLFVVRMLTQKMRGKIRFESQDGLGTTFYLSFLKA